MTEERAEILVNLIVGLIARACLLAVAIHFIGWFYGLFLAMGIFWLFGEITSQIDRLENFNKMVQNEMNRRPGDNNEPGE